MIPEGWTEKKLEEVIKLGSGETKPTDTQAEQTDSNPYPVYGGNGVMGYSSKHNSTDADIVIGRVGEYCGITRFVDGPKWITDNALYTKKISAGFDPKFLTLKLQYFNLSRLRSKGGQPLVSQKPIYALKQVFPKRLEQDRIVEVISTWDRAIKTTEKLIANSEAQKKALMQQLLTGKKRLPGFGGAWKEMPLTDVVKVSTGSSNREDSELEGPYTFFDRSTDIRRSERYLFDCEAVIVGGEGQEFIPKFFEGKFDLHQRAYAIHEFDGWCPKFIFYTVYHNRHLLLRYAVGSTVASLRMGSFSKIPVRVISLNEQKAISRALWRADKEISLLTGKLKAFRHEKAALMQQLLTGKRRVKVDEEVEAA